MPPKASKLKAKQLRAYAQCADKKSKAGVCATQFCRNKRAYNQATKSSYLLCWKCRSRKFKAMHPYSHILRDLRTSAKRRNIPITLTIEEFTAWCKKTGHAEKVGRTPSSMTVNRIDPNKGYHIWNIEPLSHKENSDEGRAIQAAMRVEQKKVVVDDADEDDPF